MKRSDDIIFAILDFGVRMHPEQPEASSNLLGSILGGFVEYASLLFDMSSLAGITLLVYALPLSARVGSSLTETS